MDLIGTLSSTLGIDNTKAEAVAGTVLGAVRGQVAENASPDATAQMDAAIPQLSGWMATAKSLIGGKAEPEAPASAPGGGLSGLFEAAQSGSAGGLFGAGASALGGKDAGDIAKIGVILNSFGVDGGKAAMAAPVIVSFLKDKLPDSVFDTVLSAAPLLASLKQGGGSAGGSAGGGIAGAVGGLFG